MSRSQTQIRLTTVGGDYRISLRNMDLPMPCERTLAITPGKVEASRLVSSCKMAFLEGYDACRRAMQGDLDNLGQARLLSPESIIQETI